MNAESSGTLIPADIVKLSFDALIAKLECPNYQLQAKCSSEVVDSQEFRQHDAP